MPLALNQNRPTVRRSHTPTSEQVISMQATDLAMQRLHTLTSRYEAMLPGSCVAFSRGEITEQSCSVPESGGGGSGGGGGGFVD